MSQRAKSYLHQCMAWLNVSAPAVSLTPSAEEGGEQTLLQASQTLEDPMHEVVGRWAGIDGAPMALHLARSFGAICVCWLYLCDTGWQQQQQQQQPMHIAAICEAAGSGRTESGKLVYAAVVKHISGRRHKYLCILATTFLPESTVPDALSPRHTYMPLLLRACLLVLVNAVQIGPVPYSLKLMPLCPPPYVI